ncbi:hypothetical protein SNEBB_010720 [Seison nebaliae]|nr:hypothetical protein SNEBB_010720 [Seison nebaliae]
MSIASEFPLQIHNIGKRHICFIAQTRGNQRNEPNLATFIELKTPKLCRKFRIIQEFPFYNDQKKIDKGIRNYENKWKYYENGNNMKKTKIPEFKSPRPRIFNSLFNRLCCATKTTDISEITIQSIRRKSKAFPMFFKKMYEWEKKKSSNISSFDNTSTLAESTVDDVDLKQLEQRVSHKDSKKVDGTILKNSYKINNITISRSVNHIPPELAKPSIILESNFNLIDESK